MAETLNIKISVNGSGSGGQSDTENEMLAGDEIAKENAKTFFKLSQAERVVVNLGKQVANTAISNIGFYTGNEMLQDQVQQGISVVSEAIGVAAAFASNVYVGIAAIGTSIISHVSEFVKTQKMIERQNYQAQQLARRAGYLSNQNR